MGWLGPDALAVVRSTRVTCWISFALVFDFMYCGVRIFALSPFLYLDLNVLGDSLWTS